MQSWLERVWYDGGRGGAWLRPLACLFGLVVDARRSAYRRGWLTRVAQPRPVVVVGNLTVGGSGKTPLVAWLALRLAERGIKVGIASRGYGGTADEPMRLGPDTDATIAGDEPILLARQTGVPVAIGRDRVGAAALLPPEVQLVIADDGLQHYRLARNLEILVIDGERRFGNGRLLPAGPLREPVSRADEADLLVVNGGAAREGELRMSLVPGDLITLDGGRRRSLRDFVGQRVHAVAAIGNPARFFSTLKAAGLEPIEHPHPDHATLTASDLDFADGLPVLMTEKDAVKCAGLAREGVYWLEVSAAFTVADATRLLDRVAALVPCP